MIINLYNVRYSIVLLISVLLTFVYSTKDENFELKLLNVVFRHGDRTPANNEKYPNDPYLNYDFYPMGRGQLTKTGMLNEYRLGEYLRKRYDNYLGSIYFPNKLHSISSDYDRTKASLQLVLAGLFPPKGIHIWNSELNWQPIPTKYIPKLNDNLFLADECPRYLDEYNKVLASAEFKKEYSQYEDLIAELIKYTGKNISTPVDISSLYHSLMATRSMGLPLPGWTKPLFPYGRLHKAAIFSYKASNYNKLLRKLYGGNLLKEFIKNMVGYVNGTSIKEKKLFLYSGHEINIACLLYSLNIYEPHVPEYSSSIITELLYREGIYYVKVLYYLGIPPQLKVFQIPGCEDPCPLNKFLQLTIDDIPSDEEMVCDKTKTSDYVYKKKIFRHGDRTPENNHYEKYPNDPYLNYDFYPTGRGQLTKTGMLREYRLGEFLRRRYDDYLGPTYFPNKLQESPEFKKENAQYDDLKAELTKYTGKNISTPIDISYLYHTLTSESFLGLPLPGWTKPFYPHGRLYNATLFSYKSYSYNKPLRRLYGGSMLKEFIKNMIEYVNGTSKVEKKMYLFSGHETNIASLLYTLNVFKPHAPSYSSSIIMELLYKKGIYYIKVLYYLGIPAQLEVLQIPGCENPCPLNKFFQLTIDDIPSDKEMICDKTTTPEYANLNYNLVSSKDLYNFIENYINTNKL
ncbi:hypothetical protein M0802_001067 [Mischocyttarus mexicanus]|nr:hypothetical protein M0802_001067 [Mischocyttarus mexicanus]